MHPHNIGPGNINQSHVQTNSTTQTCSTTTFDNGNAPRPPASIEEWHQLHDEDDSDALETRASPDFDIAYKQNVSTEDVFLQMGNKTAATSSCDEMVISIRMPNETVGIERMQLTVRRSDIDLQSPVYRLKMSLPHTIDPDAGSAQYDATLKQLTLRLKIVREFDYVNF